MFFFTMFFTIYGGILKVHGNERVTFMDEKNPKDTNKLNADEEKRIIREEDLETEIIDVIDDFEEVEDLLEEENLDEEEEFLEEEIIVERKKPKKKTKKVKTKTKKQSKKGQSKRNVFIALGLLLLLGLAVFTSWKFYFSFEEYNPFDLVHIKEQGADGQAYLDIEIVEENLSDKELMISELIDFEIRKNENLSKGDSREIKIILDDAAKKKLKDNKIRLIPLSMEYTMGELEDIKVLDVLENIDLDYVLEDGKYRLLSVDINISDLDLKSLIEFKLPKQSIAPNEKFEISIIETKELEKYLIDNGLQLERYKKELSIESKESIPANVKEIPIAKNFEEKALNKIINDYSQQEGSYKEFKVHSICYTNDVQNNTNSSDVTSGNSYQKGSLMYIVEFNSEEGVFADNYGFTNIVLRDGKLIEDEIIDIRPKQENASVDSIARELRANNFTCTRP